VVKSWIAAALLAAVLMPAVAVFAPAAHECTDHVCLCSGSRPSRVARPETCHGARTPGRPDCEVRSGCRHDRAARVTFAAAGLAPSVFDTRVRPQARAIGLPEARRPHAGVLRIDSPPPERA